MKQAILSGLSVAETHEVSGAFIGSVTAANIAKDCKIHCYYSKYANRFYFSRKPVPIGPGLHDAGYRWIA